MRSLITRRIQGCVVAKIVGISCVEYTFDLNEGNQKFQMDLPRRGSPYLYLPKIATADLYMPSRPPNAYAKRKAEIRPLGREGSVHRDHRPGARKPPAEDGRAHYRTPVSILNLI